MRRKRCDEEYADRSVTRLGRLAVKSDEETDDHAWGATRILTREEDLTLYDAAYLELAIRKRAILASCDATLLNAATHCKIETITT